MQQQTFEEVSFEQNMNGLQSYGMVSGRPGLLRTKAPMSFARPHIRKMQTSKGINSYFCWTSRGQLYHAMFRVSSDR